MVNPSSVADRNALTNALGKFFLARRDSEPAVKFLLDRPFGRRLRLEDLLHLDRTISEYHPEWALAKLWPRLSGDGGFESQEFGLPEWISVVRFAMGQVPELKPFRQWSRQYLIEWLERNLARDLLFSDEQRAWFVRCADVFAAQLTLNISDLAGEPFRPLGGVARAKEMFGAKLEAMIAELNVELMG